MAAGGLQEPKQIAQVLYLFPVKLQGVKFMENKKETESILDSLDGVQKASPSAFFFTRVQARLQKEETGFWGNLASFITKPAVATATLCLIFLLNAAALFYQKESSAAIADQNEQSLTEDYNTTVTANSYYDENTEVH
jgi:hypothetical protein